MPETDITYVVSAVPARNLFPQMGKHKLDERNMTR